MYKPWKSMHSHPCQICKVPVECDGDYERNYDGFPEVICTAYHLNSGEISEWYCMECALKQEEIHRQELEEQEYNEQE